MKHYFLLLFIHAVLSRTTVVQSESVFCVGEGCNDGPSSGVSRAIPDECPVSDCDGTGLLQHHVGQEIEGNTVTACADGATFETQPNAFMRCFAGDSLGCTTEREIESVYFSSRFVSSSAQEVTVEVDINLYEGGMDGCSTVENVRDLWGEDPIVSLKVTMTSDDNAQKITVPIPQFVRFTETDSLLVEISVPDLLGVASFHISDTDSDDDCDVSYLQSSGACGIQDGPYPTNGSVINRPFSHFVIALNTKEAPPPTPFPTTAPTISKQPTAAPVEPPVMPSGRPVPAPPNTCFSDCDVVTLLGGTQVTMDQVRVGDYLQTVTGQYTRVFSLAHYHPEAEAEFIQIYTSHNEKPLEMTADHLIFVNGTAVRASRVQVGDVVNGGNGESLLVTNLSKVKRRGVYAPLTESGDLLVNGIHVSSYVGILDAAVWNQHVLGHLLFSPVRIYCHWHSCQSEGHDEMGFSQLYSGLIWLVVWIGRAGTTVSWLVTALAAPFLGAAWVVEQVLCHNALATTAFAALASSLACCRFVVGPHKRCTSSSRRSTKQC